MTKPKYKTGDRILVGQKKQITKRVHQLLEISDRQISQFGFMSAECIETWRKITLLRWWYNILENGQYER